MCIDIVKVKEQKADELLRKIFNLEEKKIAHIKNLTIEVFERSSQSII